MEEDGVLCDWGATDQGVTQCGFLRKGRVWGSWMGFLVKE